MYWFVYDLVDDGCGCHCCRCAECICAFVEETTKHCVYCQLDKCLVEWANTVFSVPLLTVELVRAFIISVELCALVVRLNSFILKIHFEMQ